MEEKELVRLAKNGDENAFLKLYEKYDQKIERFVYARVDEVQEAEDLISEIWEKIFHCLKSFRGEFEHSFGAWIFTIIRNNLYNFYKKKTQREVVSFDKISELFFSKNPEFEDYFEKKNVDAFIEQLPSKQQQIIKMKYFQDFKNKEIALALNISEKTVSSALVKALKKLSRLKE